VAPSGGFREIQPNPQWADRFSAHAHAAGRKNGNRYSPHSGALEAAGRPPVAFDYDDYNFSVILFSSLRAEQGGTLNGTSNGTLNEKISEMIRQQPGIQRKEFIEQTGASVRTVARIVSELLSGGKIEHRGSKKTGGYWIL
jgi:ATP-dependent DNA helicase RecG